MSDSDSSDNSEECEVGEVGGVIFTTNPPPRSVERLERTAERQAHWRRQRSRNRFRQFILGTDLILERLILEDRLIGRVSRGDTEPEGHSKLLRQFVRAGCERVILETLLEKQNCEFAQEQLLRPIDLNVEHNELAIWHGLQTDTDPASYVASPVDEPNIYWPPWLGLFYAKERSRGLILRRTQALMDAETPQEQH